MAANSNRFMTKNSSMRLSWIITTRIVIRPMFLSHLPQAPGKVEKIDRSNSHLIWILISSKSDGKEVEKTFALRKS